MNNYIILNKRKNIEYINHKIKELKMINTLKNRRTNIWENDDLQISIDKSIIRILIFSNDDIKYYSNIFKR